MVVEVVEGEVEERDVVEDEPDNPDNGPILKHNRQVLKV